MRYELATIDALLKAGHVVDPAREMHDCAAASGTLIAARATAHSRAL